MLDIKYKEGKKAYIFDLDDTLLECHVNYCFIISKFITEIVKEMGRFSPHPLDIAKVQTETDASLISEESYKKDRFPLSFELTYKHFYDERIGDKKYNKEFIEHIRKLGYSVFDIIPKEIPNAFNLLDRMVKNNIPIYILTAGELEPQRHKILSTRVREFFKAENIFINNKKEEEEFKEVISKIQKDNKDIKLNDIVMIGDSLKNDIKPSTNLGLSAIFLNVNSWKFNHTDVDKDKYITVHDLFELEDLIF